MFAVSMVGDMQGGYFTKDKKKMDGGEFAPPQGANDMHMGMRLVIVWTKDNKPIGASIAPEGANDVHFGDKDALKHDGGSAWAMLSFNTPPDLRK